MQVSVSGPRYVYICVYACVCMYYAYVCTYVCIYLAIYLAPFNCRNPFELDFTLHFGCQRYTYWNFRAVQFNNFAVRQTWLFNCFWFFLNYFMFTFRIITFIIIGILHICFILNSRLFAFLHTMCRYCLCFKVFYLVSFAQVETGISSA